jgi:hypothetical protein
MMDLLYKEAIAKRWLLVRGHKTCWMSQGTDEQGDVVSQFNLNGP